MKPKNFLLSFTLAGSFGIGLSHTASAQTTYVMPTTTSAMAWNATTLGATGNTVAWVDDSSATGSIADLRGWNGGSAAMTITSGQTRSAYQLIMDQGGSGRMSLGGGNAASNLTIGAGGIINESTVGATYDVRTQITLGASQEWKAGVSATQTLIMDFRPSSTNSTKLNLAGNNLTVGDRVSLQFDLGNTTLTPYTFIGTSGTITAGGAANTGTIGLASQEAHTNETLDLTGATLAVTSANRSGVAFGRGSTTGNIILIDGMSGTSAGGGGVHRGGFSFGTSTTVVTSTTVQLVGSGSYTVDARIQDSNAPVFSGTSLLIQKTGSGTQTFAGASTAATGGGSWNSSAALQVDNGKFIISGDKNGTGAMTVGAAGENKSTLIVNGTAAGTTTVNANGTLGGSGTISSATSIKAGGIHSAAATLGTATDVQKFTGNLTYEDASIFSWEIAKTNEGAQARGIDYDAVNVTGTLAGLDGADDGTTTDAIFRVVIGDANFEDAFWNSDRTWGDIFTDAGGSGDKANWAAIFGGGFQYYKTDGTVLGTPTAEGSFSFVDSGTSLKWTVVPEPTSALAGLLIGAGLLRRRRC